MATEAEKFAQDYGFALAFLKSDPGLYKIFQQAMAGDWDSTRFIAAVKASPWYKSHGEAYRTNLALKMTDPATWNVKIANQMATMADIFGDVGATLSATQRKDLAEKSILMGWNDSQIREVISTYIKVDANSTGIAGDVRASLIETGYRNGIRVSDAYATSWAKRVASGQATTEDAQRALRNQYADAIAPQFAEQIKAGADLYDLASPYMQTMAQTLELNPSDIDLFDPTIRKALAAPGQDGKASTQPLWQFEQTLRQDARFMKTKQAQDQVMAVGHKVLKDFGMVGS